MLVLFLINLSEINSLALVLSLSWSFHITPFLESKWKKDAWNLEWDPKSMLWVCLFIWTLSEEDGCHHITVQTVQCGPQKSLSWKKTGGTRSSWQRHFLSLHFKTNSHFTCFRIRTGHEPKIQWHLVYWWIELGLLVVLFSWTVHSFFFIL